MQANSIGLQNAVQFADAVKARAVFASTSEIYGSLNEESFREEHWESTNSFGNPSCYDETKRFGVGQQTRSFCFVDDLITGTCQYALKNITLPVNLGQDEVITINNLAKTISKVLQKEVSIVFKPLLSNYLRQRRPDLPKALQLLVPWRLEVFLQQGLKIMAESMRYNR